MYVQMLNDAVSTRNLLRIAIFNITYIRGLFPEKYFNDKSVSALGVYDALQKKYLRTLLFCVCEAVEGPMIEEYAFSFSYSDSDSQEVLMNINRTGNKKHGGTFKCDSMTEVTPNQMRSSACKMVRTLIQLMRTLDRMPEERVILMKLLYYDDVTPVDYEPPFFRSCSEQEAHNPWKKNPLKMEVGNVNSKHFVLALKVKSVLDPCEDDNEDIQDDDVSLGADSVQREEYSESESDTSKVLVIVKRLTKDKFFAYLIPHYNKQCAEDTQDPVEDEQQLGRVKDWISCYHLDNVELTDVFSNFPDISVKFDYEFDAVKEEMNVSTDNKAPHGMGEDHMYMQALYHALPMEYITVAKLQSKLEGEVNQTTTRKLIEKMTRDGFLEAKSSRRLGSNHRDMSTCGVFQSIGSDLTRTRGRSETHQNGAISEQNGNTPVSRAEPVTSRESFTPGNENCKANGNANHFDECDTVICTGSTQDNKSRRVSMVKEPILQNMKRHKSQAP
ncbi:HORMA domain [Sarracenia purpurea var. burkii]